MYKIGRIDQIVRDYFDANRSVREVAAKDLMSLFIQKGIFLKDHRNGFPIRYLLDQPDTGNKLHLLKHGKVIRREVNRNWYFTKR